MPLSTFDDANFPNPPEVLHAIRADTMALGFQMSSTYRNGAMLCALAASKPNGRLLELGTGTGVATAWILHGMSAEAALDTIDNDETCVAVAKRHLGHDSRVRFHIEDGGKFLRMYQGRRFDLIFADSLPGKFTGLNEALSLLNPGGFYIVDDLLPQPTWPEGHAPKVPRLMQELVAREDLMLWPLQWDTGVIIATKKA